MRNPRFLIIPSIVLVLVFIVVLTHSVFSVYKSRILYEKRKALAYSKILHKRLLTNQFSSKINVVKNVLLNPLFDEKHEILLKEINPNKVIYTLASRVKNDFVTKDIDEKYFVKLKAQLLSENSYTAVIKFENLHIVATYGSFQNGQVEYILTSHIDNMISKYHQTISLTLILALILISVSIWLISSVLKPVQTNIANKEIEQDTTVQVDPTKDSELSEEEFPQPSNSIIENTLNNQNDSQSDIKHETTPKMSEINSDNMIVDNNIGKVMPLNILVVENNGINQQVIKKFLTTFSCVPDIVESGVSAINAIDNKNYDVLFMDTQMQDMTVLETTKTIKEKFKYNLPTIIPMTTNLTKADEHNYIEAGIDNFLPKPVELEQLYKLLLKIGTQNSKISQADDKTEDSLEDRFQNTINGLDIPSINKDTFISSYKTSPDIIPEIVEIFISQYEEKLEKIHLAITTKNDSDLEASAHAFKGMVANFHVNDLVDLLLYLETCGEEDNFDAVESTFEKSKHLSKVVAKELQTVADHVSKLLIK